MFNSNMFLNQIEFNLESELYYNMDSILNKTGNTIFQNEYSASTLILSANDTTDEKPVNLFYRRDKQSHNKKCLTIHINDNEIEHLKKRISKLTKTKLFNVAEKYISNLKIRLVQMNRFAERYPLTFMNHEANMKTKLFEICHHTALNLRENTIGHTTDVSRYLINIDSLKKQQLETRKNQKVPLITLLNVVTAFVSCEKSIHDLYIDKFEGILIFSVFSQMLTILSKFYELQPFRRKFSNRQSIGDSRTLLKENLDWVF